MIRITQLKLWPEETEADLAARICRKLKIEEKELRSWKLTKKSIDARKKDAPHYVCQVDVSLKKKEAETVKRLRDRHISLVKETGYRFPVKAAGAPALRPVIAGTGPAGLFCGYMLAEAGFAPILLERGGPVEDREQAVERFWKTGELDPECNVQFGEGGAGTFSDGKLNTLVRDHDGKGRRVLELFAAMGADEEILYEQKPHIGTDVLKQVLKNLRGTIEAMGGEFRFYTKLSGIRKEQGRLKGIDLESTDQTQGEKEQFLETDCLILAIGHSARDTFAMLDREGLVMRPKSFAVGLRIEHPQEMIQLSQYGETYAGLLPPASYKLTAKASDGRGVYSFCMCPGGYVVNASSEKGMTAVNGMSNRKRDGKNANSAMIVTVSPADFGGSGPLAGVEFQRKLERLAFAAGSGRIPVQLYGDFKENRLSTSFGGVSSETKGEICFANLRQVLPEFINRALIEGIGQCGNRIAGFDRYDAVLSGVESRTSSPVRIERNEAFLGSIPGIYPCGEGAGYAGGIMSAAMDGIRVAEAVARRYDGDPPKS